MLTTNDEKLFTQIELAAKAFISSGKELPPTFVFLPKEGEPMVMSRTFNEKELLFLFADSLCTLLRVRGYFTFVESFCLQVASEDGEMPTLAQKVSEHPDRVETFMVNKITKDLKVGKTEAIERRGTFIGFKPLFDDKEAQFLEVRGRFTELMNSDFRPTTYPDSEAVKETLALMRRGGYVLSVAEFIAEIKPGAPSLQVC